MHPVVGEACQGLGSLYHHMGKYVEAERYVRRSLSIRQVLIYIYIYIYIYMLRISQWLDESHAPQRLALDFL
jgi:hypothetical protein